jgi:UDP-N-acetylmuramoyl-L-alanyl-D-glutamate--2,6-diaminopimelate ligase
MRGLTLSQLVRELGGRAELGSALGDDTVVTGVRQDSRAVMPGDLFVARRGAAHDGIAYLRDAIARGAVAVLLERGAVDGRDLGVPAIVTGDMGFALANAAAAVYGHPTFSLDVIGITGTNGKTTTTHLVRDAIDGVFGRPTCGIVGTIGNRFGGETFPTTHTTPEADEIARTMALMRQKGATTVAMEVSSIALELARVKAVRFRVAAFTNFTQDHLDFHGTMEAYGDAKARLFDECSPGSACINVADPFGRALADRVRAPTVRVSPRPGDAADIVAESVHFAATGMEATFRTPSGKVGLASRLVGRHNVENVAVALGVCAALDLDLQRAADAIGRTAGVPGRLERCDEPADDLVVLVDYAHTPDALERVLEAVRDVTTGRIVCVFGCGGDRDPKKRGPMGDAVAAAADVALITSDNPRTEDPTDIARPIVDAVRARGLGELTPAAFAAGERGYLLELDRARAIRLAIASAKAGDVVLLAGKGHEDYQIVGTQKTPFDDRLHARAALAARRAR